MENITSHTISCPCGITKHPRAEQTKEERPDCPICDGTGHVPISTLDGKIL